MSKKCGRIIEYFVDDLVPGMEIARDICCTDGKILISQNTELNNHVIHKLKTWEIKKVTIYQEAPVNVFADPKVQQFMESYNKSVTVVDQAFAAMRRNQAIPIEALTDTAEQITETVAGTGNIIDQLYNMPHCDDYTHFHSVNVSVICALLGQWLKLPSEGISALSLAGLLHDIGKSQLPPELLNRTDLLTAEQYSQYRLHTMHGAKLVSQLPDLANSIRQAVEQHHERQDGSGYPEGLTGKDIHPYARIVAVADIYDESLTINRNPDIVLSPYSALEAVRDQLHLIDAKATLTLIDNMTNFLSGNKVVLTDNQAGRVVCVNKERPSRSVIQLDDGTIRNLDDNGKTRINYIAR